MRDIRDVAMDCIGYDALERRLPHDLAVIWIDADTTFISQNAISSIISRLKNDFNTFLVQPNLIFTGHQGDTRPMREREPSEKYATSAKRPGCNNAKDIGIAATFAAHEPDARIGTSYRSIQNLPNGATSPGSRRHNQTI